MSTRCFICVGDDEQGYRGIYCHYDGYPKHVGRLLVEFHRTYSDALRIIEGSQIRNFDSDGTVVRYGDGATNESNIFSSIVEALSCGFDYLYLYNDGKWKCFAQDQLFNTVIHEMRIPGTLVSDQI